MRRTAVLKLILSAIIIALLLLLSPTSCSAGRPDPALRRASEFEGVRRGGLEGGCEGEEDCLLMRRTLSAHLDYIYTQQQKHKH
ncbi:hypothetical protein MLD38_028987 [Melastoma candidum]|uniref:Uncharacterized protein n=1 Tax=Melastoma candidum TaxID=119954 RepID=A0ACB9N2R8_9MYRT|nr:hypothetical protein MLD38_028987 [Melastoma candidum]